MDFEAVGWRPARRLRHVTAVRLHNLYDPASDGPASYCYEMCTWNPQQCVWTLFYRSEQLPTNNDLDWGRQQLDPESETALQGLHHRPDVGPLRLRVYAAGGDRSAQALSAVTSRQLHRGSCTVRLDAAAAAAPSWAPSDYDVQHLPRMRQEAECCSGRNAANTARGEQHQSAPLPLPIAELSQFRVSAAGGSCSTAGNANVPDQRWGQSRPEPDALLARAASTSAMPEALERSWGEVSGPGPPILQQHQPKLHVDIDSACHHDSGGEDGGGGGDRGGGGGGTGGEAEREFVAGRLIAIQARSVQRLSEAEQDRQGQELGRWQARQEQAQASLEAVMQRDAHTEQEQQGQDQNQGQNPGCPQRRKHNEQEQDRGEKKMAQQEDCGRQPRCGGSSRAAEGTGPCLDPAAAVPAPPASPGTNDTPCSAAGPGVRSGSSSSSRSRSSDFEAMRLEVSAGQVSSGGVLESSAEVETVAAAGSAVVMAHPGGGEAAGPDAGRGRTRPQAAIRPQWPLPAGASFPEGFESGRLGRGAASPACDWRQQQQAQERQQGTQLEQRPQERKAALGELQRQGCQGGVPSSGALQRRVAAAATRPVGQPSMAPTGPVHAASSSPSSCPSPSPSLLPCCSCYDVGVVDAAAVVAVRPGEPGDGVSRSQLTQGCGLGLSDTRRAAAAQQEPWDGPVGEHSGAAVDSREGGNRVNADRDCGRHRVGEEPNGGDDGAVGDGKGDEGGGGGSAGCGGITPRLSCRGGGGSARLLLEHVFELRDLVLLEARTLRHGWHINLPVLLMHPDRRPFAPLSALPPPLPPPLPPAPQPLPPLLRQSPSCAASAMNGGSHAGRWRFSALQGAGVGGGGGGGGGARTGWLGGAAAASNGDRGPGAGMGAAARGTSSEVAEVWQQPAGERLVDDKRALLRWLLSSSSVVQPLEAAGSLEPELQDEAFLAAAAEERAAAPLPPAAPAAGWQAPWHFHHHDHDHDHDHAPLPQPRRPHSNYSNHYRSFSAEDAAALLDPGPAPGFLPSAVAVLFRQEWARAAAAAPPGLRRSRSPGLDAPPLAAAAAASTTRFGSAGSGSGRASPAGRRVASTPSMATVAEAVVEADAPEPSEEASEEVVGDSGGSEAGRLPGSARASVENRGSLLRRFGTPANGLAHGGGGGYDRRFSAPASPSSSTTSYAAAAAAAGRAAMSPFASGFGGSQVSLTGLATAAVASGRAASSSPPPQSYGHDDADFSSTGQQHPWLPVSPLPRPSSGPLSSSASSGQLSTTALGGVGERAGGDAQPPLPTPSLPSPPPIDSGPQRGGGSGGVAAAVVAGGKRMPPGRRSAAAASNEQPYHHNHQYTHEQLSAHTAAAAAGPAAATAGPLTAAAVVAPAVQRLCELAEVRASIRKLTQLQERLTATRAGALGLRRRLEAAVERRQRLDEALVRAEGTRAEGREWAVRAEHSEMQLSGMRAAAAQLRRELQDRARALETAARTLQAAEQRRLNAEDQLAGPSGRGHLAALTAALVGRRNRLVSELGRIFQIGPISEALLEPDPLDLALDSSWAGEWGCLGSFGREQREEPGQQIAAGPPRGQQRDPEEPEDTSRRPTAGRAMEGAGAAATAAEGAAAPSAPVTGGGGRGSDGDGSGGVVARGGGGSTRLAVMGLELPPDLIERSLQGSTSWSQLDLGRRYDADQRTAAGLGYLAAMVDLAASYLCVPLRYPIAPRVSVSYISDPVPPSVSVRSGAAGPTAAVLPPMAAPLGAAGSAAAAALATPGTEWRLLNIASGSLSAAAAVVAAATSGSSQSALGPPLAVGLIPGPRGVGVGGRLAVFSALLNAQLDPWVAATPAGAIGDDAHPAGLNPVAGLPLFWGDGARDRTRFAYAVYLLSKDIEQLLEAHGIPPVATNQPLPNLYVLITAAASGVPRAGSSGGGGGKNNVLDGSGADDDGGRRG